MKSLFHYFGCVTYALLYGRNHNFPSFSDVNNHFRIQHVIFFGNFNYYAQFGPNSPWNSLKFISLAQLINCRRVFFKFMQNVAIHLVFETAFYNYTLYTNEISSKLSFVLKTILLFPFLLFPFWSSQFLSLQNIPALILHHKVFLYDQGYTFVEALQYIKYKPSRQAFFVSLFLFLVRVL